MRAPENAYAVILAGGGGTRLWPKSRKNHPKHLLKLVGKKTLLRDTFENFNKLFPNERIIVITLKSHVDQVKQQLPEIPDNNFIIEPESKNTALAMGTAAAYIHQRNPNAVIINEAADHLYQDIGRFQAIVLAALDVALSFDYIVSIGIRPTFPHTGLGYIWVGEQLGHVKVYSDEKSRDIYTFKALGFKEKPDLATAQSFIATGKYLWNANLYCWSTKTILDAFKKHSPKISEGLEKILSAIGTKEEDEVVKKVYSEAPTEQIDTAVSEKAKNLVVIPGDFGWSDIGDWNIVFDSLKKDEFGNAIADTNGNHLSMDTRDSLIETNGRLVVTIGVSDLVIIDTEDAVLICPKDRTQEVKKVVEKLKELKKDKYL
ncbi:mannose-1-phosphate guanylyltransferase [Candidatus Daviesbacteria bacterium]|nr:mannose-1-phosphate guanylyltransferase [Candidatus Daviesbacteria bacterium]